MNRIARYWYRMSSSFWFVPGVIVTAAVLLALVTIEADARYVTKGALEAWPRMFGAGSGASRSLLTAIAGSMITVAGTVFSITLVALSLASSQYSSRVLRNFMRDRTNQTVLGVFIGIFAYCLVVLRSIYENGDTAFVPAVAVLLGLVLGFGGMGVLVFFIHHIAQSIQASQIIEAVRAETAEAIDRLFPEPATCRESCVEGGQGEWWPAVHAPSSGYLQFVDYAALRRIACAHGVRFDAHARIGDYVLEGDLLLSASMTLPSAAAKEAGESWALGVQRTLEQDAGFGIRQLVDVALKALSPGINDTTTAVMCVDALTSLLARLGQRDLRFSGCSRDGTEWVRARHPQFGELLDQAFDQIRQSGEGNVVVLERLCWSIGALVDRVPDPARRDALRRHASRVGTAGARGLEDPAERLRVARQVQEIETRLAGASLPSVP